MAAQPFDEFYARYFPEVRRYAARRFGADDADDIAQETMIRAYRAYQELDDGYSVGPWLVTVAHRVGISARRRRRPVTLDTDVLHDLAPSVPDRTAEVAARVDIGGLLRSAMQRLSRNDREVLTLHEVCGLGLTEIAASSGASPNTVRQRLFRARLNLQRHYRELGGTNYAPPLAPAAAVRSRRQRAYDTVHSLAHRAAARVGAQPPARGTAVAAIVALTATITPPSALHRPPNPTARPSARTATTRLDIADVAAHLPLPALPQPGVRLPAALPTDRVVLPYVAGFETGLAGWAVTGATATVDCLPGHHVSGLCALRLDPVGSVRVSRPFDIGLRSVLRAEIKTTSARGVATFDLGLDTGRVTVTVDPVRHRIGVAAPGAAPAGVDLLATDWYWLTLVVDPVAGTVSVAQSAYNDQQLAPAILTLPDRPSRVRDIGLAATGGPTDTVWFDDIVLRRAKPECSDGIDNDGDGRIDADDHGCYVATDDSESPDPQCSDGVDNDGDGLVDTADPSCNGYANSPLESTGCSDGVDNDGDGLTDYPADPQCDAPNDNAEVPACRDHGDDDSDGTYDYPADLGCTSPEDDDEMACAILRLDSTGLPTYLGAPEQQHRPFAAGACLEPVERVLQVAVVALGDAVRTRGRVDLYRWHGADIPCVVLTRPDERADACAAIGATYVRPLATLVSADTLPPTAGGRGWVCTAAPVVFARVGANEVDRIPVALTLC